MYLLLIAVIASLCAPVARAQEVPRATEVQDDSVYPEFADSAEDAPTARLRLVLDLVSGATAMPVAANVPFEVHVVAHDVQVALRGWEARLVHDPRLVFLDKKLDADIDIGKGTEVRAAYKPRNCKTGTPIVLGTFRFMLTEEGAQDLVLGLAPADPASVPSVETEVDLPAPIYLVCRPGADLRPFDACETCVVINPAQIAPESDAPPSPLDSILAPVKGRQD